MLTEDAIAPPLDIALASGETMQLNARGDGPLVVYFYPKDDTPGCTSEAKDFSELMPQFHNLGARVVGISRDTIAKHATFAAKHALTIDLGSDEAGLACEVFGTWVEKSLYGRNYMGVERATFLFDSNRRLVREWRKVKVKGHAAIVLEAAQAL